MTTENNAKTNTEQASQGFFTEHKTAIGVSAAGVLLAAAGAAAVLWWRSRVSGEASGETAAPAPTPSEAPSA